MPNIHPEFPMNFQFIVNFDNSKFSSDTDFHSVSGISTDLVTKLIPGNIFRPNTNRKKVLRPDFQSLVLKRAYRPNSILLEWVMDAINHNKRESENLTIRLLNTNLDFVSAWMIKEAIPIGYHIAELNAGHPEVLMETITLKYNYFEIVNGEGQIISPKDPQ